MKKTLTLVAGLLVLSSKGVPNAVYERGRAQYERAEALYEQGDREGCIAELEKLAASKENFFRRGCPDWKFSARTSLVFLRGLTCDERRLPRFTGAKAYPMPQEATYEDAFSPIGKVALRLEGVAADAAPVRLLKTKLGRFGTVFGETGFALHVVCRADAPVDKAEGYALEICEKGATIQARDRLGVLWGLVSFIQCVDQPACAVRRCKVRDWPDCAKRGYLCRASEFHLEFALFNKINSVNFQDDAWGAWDRMTPLEMMKAREQARSFKEFGLDFYYGIASSTMYPQTPLSDEETFRRHRKVCAFYASCGAHVYFPFDDGRFPLPAADKERFGTAANVDAKYVTRLYRSLKAEYPDFKMVFCPPFYWGPDSPASYPEDRETYLKSLAASLDPEIDVYWTGPMVKGYDKSPSQVGWFAGLVGRRPSIFQNGCGAHNLVSYGVDPTPWSAWHYKGFTKDVAMFHQNTNYAEDGVQIGTLADYLWNEAAYDATASVRRSVEQLAGKGVYEPLAAALPALASFDRYKYGELTVEILHEDLADMEARLAVATNAWAKACAASDATVRYLGGFGRGCGWAAEATRRAHRPPDFLSRHKDDIAKTEALAKAELGYDKAKGDILFTAVDTAGAAILSHTDQALPKDKQRRLGKCLRGAQTSQSEITGRFECDPFPPSGPYELLIVASEDERADENEIEVTVNGKSVWRGKTGLPHNDYSVLRVAIPFESMVRNNVFAVRNLTPGTNPNGTPWLVVNYMVLRKGAKAK